MSVVPDQHRRFVAELTALVAREDRAALAALRRGLGKAPGEAGEMHRYVVPWLPREAPRWQEDAYYLVAALFAWHQRNWSGGDDGQTNLGASFARLSDAAGSDSVERRFVALLNCHAEDLPVHLRHAVGLLRTHEIPVDWARLIGDIQGWSRESRSVQRAWARAYWGRAQTPQASDADGTDADRESATARA